MRQPHQILAFPYKKSDNGEYVYAVFCRIGNHERWQGIAGGVEEGETFLEACKREANEEASISYNAKCGTKFLIGQSFNWRTRIRLLLE